jgi:hypothetical protein
VELDDDDMDLSGEMTLGDMYRIGDSGGRKVIEDLAQAHADLLGLNVDEDELRRVRTGGHAVRVGDEPGIGEVQIEIYRTGPAYGYWNLSHSPEGHMVRIEHALPTSYKLSGRFDTCRTHHTWTVPAAEWRRDPATFIEDLVGKKIAREVAPLLQLPDEIAPDASQVPPQPVLPSKPLRGLGRRKLLG